MITSFPTLASIAQATAQKLCSIEGAEADTARLELENIAAALATWTRENVPSDTEHKNTINNLFDAMKKAHQILSKTK